MSRMVMRLSRRALRRARPGATERELDLAFVELHYGKDLADRLGKDLVRRE